MKIVLLSEDAIRLEPDPGPMTIEALEPEQQYSPFHMLASSLAVCTFSVMPGRPRPNRDNPDEADAGAQVPVASPARRRSA